MEMRDFPGVRMEMSPAVDNRILFTMYSITGRSVNAHVAVVQEWCRDQFGVTEGMVVHSTTLHAAFLFRDPNNATAFRMRWC